MTNYRTIRCDSACHKLKRKMPYGWDLNIFRGCEHSCKYCYALYSHNYMEETDFFHDIFIKENVVDELEKQLRQTSWKQEVVNIGGITDSYQPAERTYRLMPDIIKLLIRYETPCIISTKSTLILRDFDLLDELSRITYVNIAATVTCMDESVRRKIEPAGAASVDRLGMLREFSKTNASTGLHFMPIIPYLTDGRQNVESLYEHAAQSKVSYVLPGVLYLRGKTRKVFFDFILQEFPHIYERLMQIYKKGGADQAYKNTLYEMVNEIKVSRHLCGSYSKPMKEKLAQRGYTQITLFD